MVDYIASNVVCLLFVCVFIVVVTYCAPQNFNRLLSISNEMGFQKRIIFGKESFFRVFGTFLSIYYLNSLQILWLGTPN